MKLLKNTKRNKFPVITYQLNRQLQHKYISGHKNNIASSEELSDHQHNKNCRHISYKKNERRKCRLSFIDSHRICNIQTAQLLRLIIPYTTDYISHNLYIYFISILLQDNLSTREAT